MLKKQNYIIFCRSLGLHWGLKCDTIMNLSESVISWLLGQANEFFLLVIQYKVQEFIAKATIILWIKGVMVFDRAP